MVTLLCQEKKKVFCYQKSLNIDISLNVIPTTLKFLLIILHIHWQNYQKGTFFFFYHKLNTRT